MGLLVSRREPKGFKDLYIDAPLHQSKGLLLGALIAAGAMLRRTLSTAGHAAEEIAGDVGDDFKKSMKPLRKAARQAGQRMGL